MTPITFTPEMLRTFLIRSLGASFSLTSGARTFRISELRGIQRRWCSLQNSSFMRLRLSASTGLVSIIREASSESNDVSSSASSCAPNIAHFSGTSRRTLSEEKGRWRVLCLLLARFNRNVQNIAATKNYVAIVRRWRVTSVFCGPLKDDVHVAVGVDHVSAVLDVVLEADDDFGIQFLDQQVEWLSGRLQANHWIIAERSSLR